MKNLFSKNVMFIMSLALSLTMITSCGEDEVVTPPTPDLSSVVAAFTSQVDAVNSLTYSFTNGSVVNGITDRTFTSSWDFGGEGTSTDENPTFTFSGEGTFDVVLTVTAADGVVGTETETIMVTAPLNRYASITDSFGDDNLNEDGRTDTGELRLNVDSIQTGRLTFDWRAAAGPGGDIQDGFIHVAGSSTTSDFAISELRLKDDAPHEWREGASDETIADSMFPVGMANVWSAVEVSWVADGVNTPTFSLSLDGVTIIENAISTTNGGAGDVDGHLAATMDGAANFLWKYGSNGNISDGTFHVDNIVLYSSDSGSEVIVFEDDFQARTAGDDLDPGGDELNPMTPYHINTTDASVAEDQ